MPPHIGLFAPRCQQYPYAALGHMGYLGYMGYMGYIGYIGYAGYMGWVVVSFAYVRL